MSGYMHFYLLVATALAILGLTVGWTIRRADVGVTSKVVVVVALVVVALWVPWRFRDMLGLPREVAQRDLPGTFSLLAVTDDGPRSDVWIREQGDGIHPVPPRALQFEPSEKMRGVLNRASQELRGGASSVLIHRNERSRAGGVGKDAAGDGGGRGASGDSPGDSPGDAMTLYGDDQTEFHIDKRAVGPVKD